MVNSLIFILYIKYFVLSVQKEVEEEKQARVGQVSDLLGWVKGLQGRTGGPNAESSLAAQQVQQKYNIYTLFYQLSLSILHPSIPVGLFCADHTVYTYKYM